MVRVEAKQGQRSKVRLQKLKLRSEVKGQIAEVNLYNLTFNL